MIDHKDLSYRISDEINIQYYSSLTNEIKCCLLLCRNHTSTPATNTSIILWTNLIWSTGKNWSHWSVLFIYVSLYYGSLALYICWQFLNIDYNRVTIYLYASFCEQTLSEFPFRRLKTHQSSCYNLFEEIAPKMNFSYIKTNMAVLVQIYHIEVYC